MELKITKILTALFGTTILTFAATDKAWAEGKLTVYCSVQNNTCEKMTQIFAQKYQVDTQFIRNSTGATFSKIKAEKGMVALLSRIFKPVNWVCWNRIARQSKRKSCHNSKS